MCAATDDGTLGGMYWDHMNGWGWAMMVFWTFLWVALLGVGLWGVIYWTRGDSSTSSQRQPPPRDKTAREVLDERLARGEIDLTEYQSLRDALEPRTPSAARASHNGP